MEELRQVVGVENFAITDIGRAILRFGGQITHPMSKLYALANNVKDNHRESDAFSPIIRSAMVAENGQPETSAPVEQAQADTANPHLERTAEYYLHELHRLEEGVRKWTGGETDGGIDPLDAKRARDFWTEQAEACGLDLAEASLGQLDPIRRLLSDPELVNHNEVDLKEIRSSIELAKALGAGELDVKKKWMACLAETLRLQREARKNPVHFSIYVLRCQETNRVLRMEKIHLDIFRAWNDPENKNSLTEAPPGVGKTTMMYGQDLFEMCYDRKFRFIRMCSDLTTAKNRVQVTRDYIRNRRLRALFPSIRIDPGRPDNQSEFTLMRVNIGSHDPTMKAAGATSAIQGSGCERLGCDDLCDPRVRHEPTTRKRITQNFRSVALRRRRNFVVARTRYICTPWHVDDTAAVVLRDIREGRLPGWRADLFPSHEKADGTPIPPVTRPGYEAELLTVKQTDPVTYACCYLLNPSEQSLRMLKHLVFYDESGGTDPLCPEQYKERCARMLFVLKNGEQWQVLDPAAGGVDQTGMVGFAISANGKATAIRSARFFRGKSTEAIEPICTVVQAEAADKVLIEGQGGSKGQADMWVAYIVAKFGEDYRDRLLVSGTRFRGRSGQPAGQNISKTQRFRNILPLLEDGTIMFPGCWALVNGKAQLICSRDEGLRILHEQLTQYPNVTRDDGLDCVTLFANFNVGRLVRRVKPLQKPGEPKHELPPTTNPLTLMRREMEQRMRHPENYEKGVREQELELLMAG